MHHSPKGRLGRHRRSIQPVQRARRARRARLGLGFAFGGGLALGAALLPSCGDPGDEFSFSQSPVAGRDDGAAFVGAAGEAGDGTVRRPREIGGEGGYAGRDPDADPGDFTAGESGTPPSTQGGNSGSADPGSARGGAAPPSELPRTSGGVPPVSGGSAGVQGGAPSAQGGTPSAEGGAPANGGTPQEGGSPGAGGASGNAGTSAAEGGAPSGGSASSGGTEAGGSGGMFETGGAPVATGGTGPVAPPALFFSEYVEGSGKHKAFEIVAVAPSALDGCAVRVYANGSTSASRIVMLAGTASLEAPFVVCTPEVAAVVPGACDQEESLPFNGDDAVVLSCGETVLDALGQVGVDPGDQWGGEELGTLDRTLRRSCSVAQGDADPSDAFDPALEWQAAALDSFEDLNRHCVAAAGQ